MAVFLRFNTYFVLMLVLGCSTTGKKEKEKTASTFMVHLETQAAEDYRSQEIQVFRASPVSLFVDKTAFIHTGNVVRATVVDDFGGFHIRVEVDRRGALELETMSAKHVGKRMAIYSRWSETRWIAAPKIHARIADGVIEFVPDTSLEEAERIVLGLNNVVEEARKRDKPLLSNSWGED